MSAEEAPNPVETQLMIVVAQFGAVCAAPDDPTVAAAADQALADLDALLATTVG